MQLVHLFKGLERDLQFLFLSHTILEVIPPLLEVPLADLTELQLNTDQLVHNIMRLQDLLLENLHLFRHILTAASIRCRRTVSTAFGDASLPCATHWGFHAEVVLIALIIVPSQRAISIASEEWVEEVTGERLCTDLIITAIEVNWFL